jgi:hypothetical protein
MSQRTTLYVGLPISAVFLVLLCGGGCGASLPHTIPFTTCDSLPLQGTMAPGCWTRKPYLHCYGYHPTCWCAWPAQCGKCCPTSGEIPFMEEGPVARPEAAPTAAPPRDAVPQREAAPPRDAVPGGAVPKPEER